VTNGGPCLLDDFYKNPVGTALTVGNASTYKAFSRRPDSQATTPGGDAFPKTSLDGSTTYAKTLVEFNNNSANTNVSWETRGYQSVRSAFNMYTEGLGYWGKTFFIWPPAPRGPNVIAPPASLTDTAFNWYNNQSNDWRQRFFVAVNTSTSAPSWLNHNTILFEDPTASPAATMKTPNTSSTVTENGSSVTYSFRINYAAILYWLTDPDNLGYGTNPFPSTLQAGRVRYYVSIPNAKDNTLNKRWWAFDPSNPTNSAGIPNNERYWKEYIDFVLGYDGTGPNAYSRSQSGIPLSALIGNGDYYQWSGSTPRISQRPQPQPSPSSPGAPYSNSAQVDKQSVGAYPAGTASIKIKNLASTTPASPVVNKDYVIFGNHATPYLITAYSSATATITISPGLSSAVGNNVALSLYSPYMDYRDCPLPPKHQ